MARRGLSKDLIANEALAMIDEVGLRGFSMRALATRLRVDPMSLYHHLPNREAVLDAVVDRLMVEASLPTATGTWQDWVRLAGARFVELADLHPNSFPLFAVRSVANPESLQPLETLADALLRGGFDTDEVFELVQMFSDYATGLAIQHLDGAIFAKSLAPSRVDAGMLTADRLPVLRRVARRHRTARSFERGLEAMIAGLEAELRDRAAHSSG